MCRNRNQAQHICLNLAAMFHFQNGAAGADRTREPVGPFRVYLQYAWSPGLACSRAFGDKMAVEVGVTHKPDVTVHTFQPEDQYMIMASDGIWELISSQVSKTGIWNFRIGIWELISS